jgi:hypothetical protein
MSGDLINGVIVAVVISIYYLGKNLIFGKKVNAKAAIINIAFVFTWVAFIKSSKGGLLYSSWYDYATPYVVSLGFGLWIIYSMYMLYLDTRNK